MRDRRRVLVIGGSGFLGVHLMERLKRTSSCEVVGTYYSSKPADDGRWKQLDVLDAEQCAGLIADHECVINLTGQVSRPFASTLAGNGVGVLNISRLCSDLGIHLLHVSTVAVYGQSDNVVKEEHPPSPSTTYGAVKAMSEQLAAAILPESQLGVIRLSNLFGPGQEKGLPAFLLRSFRNGTNIDFDNDGHMVRHFLHVKDAAAILEEAILNAFSGTVHVSGPQAYSIRGVVDLFQQEYGPILDISYADRAGWDSIEQFDTSVLESQFRFRPQQLLTEYIRNEAKTRDS